MRRLVTGAPRTGKTSLGIKLAQGEGMRHLCTDPQDLCPAGVAGTPLGLEWSACSEWVARHWLELPGPWVIEGVAVPRALRKWRAMHPDAPPPCDELIIMSEPFMALTTKQLAMGDNLHSVLDEMADWLAPVLKWHPG